MFKPMFNLNYNARRTLTCIDNKYFKKAYCAKNILTYHEW